MLKLMREQASSWLIKTVLWLVVVAFLGTIFYSWGMGEYSSRSEVIARVQNEKIYYKEYKEILDNLYDLYKRSFKGKNQEDLMPYSRLKKVALNTVIQRKLLLNEAREMGMEVSNQELINHIRNLPAFHIDGRFDNNIYNNFLKYNRTTPNDFENSQRTNLLLDKIQNLIKTSVKASEFELREAYHWKHEKINLDYLVIEPDIFKDQVELTAEKISGFYKNEKGNFKRPDQVRVEYLLADPVLFEKDVKIDEQDYIKYYNDHKDDFFEPETVRASHIMIKKSLTDLNIKADEKIKKDTKGDKEKQKDEARKRAEKVSEELKKGGNFEELAKKHSEDKSNAKKGGDVGYFPRGRMLKEFEDAAFSLEISDLSEIVETSFGYHIIKVTDKKQAGAKPLNEVKDEIHKILLFKKSKKLAKRTLLMISKSTDPINEFKKNISSDALEKGTTDFFSMGDDLIPLIGMSSQFKLEAFSLKENEISRIVETEKGGYLIRLLEKKEAYIPQLDEVKDEVEKLFSLQEQKKIAAREANSLLNKLKQGTPINALAEQISIETSHTDFFDRDQATNIFGMKKEFIHAAFQLKAKESVVVPISDNFYLIYMIEKTKFDEETYKKEKNDFSKDFLKDKQEKVQAAWLENLKKNAEVTINEQIL